ncbi:unnamed protein product [Aspergillus oryzae]|uniref:Unnamed protein product n=2 Tax=Aspergillus oryzae TaxID=5062 RepID=A0AAN5BWM4_ASPOZ|nr:unnamed protein product [Aspergillus oryzae]GMF93263.1 unnamed protein product [Aspergillus oryzae]GMG05664.1 unnamed protein product [Aspergillus oryzae]GMG28075.1 unnamed protein product [Aspergillus oryzae]GMG41441.1 unnamed protein product [Aspergillus oryzae var. brunneus]
MLIQCLEVQRPRRTYPSTASETLQTKLLGNFGGAHGILEEKSVNNRAQPISSGTEVMSYRQILLVSENKEKSITEFILVQHALQLFPGLDNTIAIVAIHDEDNTLSVLEVMSPERTDLVLTTDIPHGKLNVLVFDSLDVETFTTDGSMSAIPF